MFLFGATVNAEERFDITKTIEKAITENLNIKLAEEKIKASEYALSVSRTNFLPTVSTGYQHKQDRKNLERTSTFTASFAQPIFRGGSLVNQYRLATFNLDAATINEQLIKRDIIFEAKNRYFSVLKAEKLKQVAEESVKQLTSHKNVAENYYTVGLAALNDSLKAQVELANAKLAFVTAENNFKIAEAAFKTFLRIPPDQEIILEDIQSNKNGSFLEAEKIKQIAEAVVNELVSLKKMTEDYYNLGLASSKDIAKVQIDIENAKQALIAAENNIQIVLKDYTFDHDFEYCKRQSEQHRVEIKLADIDINIAKTSLKLEESKLYPSIDFKYSYSNTGNDTNLYDDEGLPPSIAENFNASLTASWEMWNWGRYLLSRKEKAHNLEQAKINRERLLDELYLEVKKAFLKTLEAEQNISVVEKAVEQAEENFRIVNRSYEQQIVNTTDVVDANTLLTHTKTNYFNALYDFKIAKASLLKEMGLYE
jgi:outer membrane protein TolC